MDVMARTAKVHSPVCGMVGRHAGASGQRDDHADNEMRCIHLSGYISAQCPRTVLQLYSINFEPDLSILFIAWRQLL